MAEESSYSKKVWSGWVTSVMVGLQMVDTSTFGQRVFLKQVSELLTMKAKCIKEEQGITLMEKLKVGSGSMEFIKNEIIQRI